MALMDYSHFFTTVRPANVQWCVWNAALVTARYTPTVFRGCQRGAEVTFVKRWRRSWGTQRASGGSSWSAPAGFLVFLRQQVGKNKNKQTEKHDNSKLWVMCISYCFRMRCDLVILDVLADAQQTPDHLSDKFCSQSSHTIVKIWLQVQHEIIGSRSRGRHYIFHPLWTAATCCSKLISDSCLCLKCHFFFRSSPVGLFKDFINPKYYKIKWWCWPTVLLTSKSTRLCWYTEHIKTYLIIHNLAIRVSPPPTVVPRHAGTDCTQLSRPH